MHLAPVLPAAISQTCSQCGESYSPDDLLSLGGLLICGRCKPLFVQRLRETGRMGVDARQYGGFWIRGGARLIDTALLWMTMTMLLFLFLGRAGVLTQPQSQNPFVILRAEGIALFLQFVIAATYEIVLTATRGGTLGKHALGLRIVTAEGRPMGWGRAAGRYFAQAITGFTFGIGYLIAASDTEKRTLHDHICATRVVRK